jgi:hypothetical protein
MGYEGREVFCQHENGDEPHRDSECLLERRAGQPRAKGAAGEHSSKAASNKQSSDAHWKLLSLNYIGDNARNRDETDHHKRCSDRSVNVYAGVKE